MPRPTILLVILACAALAVPFLSDPAAAAAFSASEGHQAATTPPNQTTTHGNSIIIEFDPARSSLAGTCDEIGQVQFMRNYLGGQVVRPSALDPSWTHKDAVTTAEGWAIDHRLASDRLPTYQQEDAGFSTEWGYKNAQGTRSITMDDGPIIHPPEGKDVYIHFVTFAWCKKGPQCGKWYEGVSWTYTRDSEDAPGVAKVFKPNLVRGPEPEHLAAFEKFNAHRGYTPCQ